MAEISLTQNKTSIIDDSDISVVSQHRWYAQKTRDGRFYAVADIKQTDGKTRRTYLHRFLLNPAKGYTVIHIDGDGLNNRRENLLLCKKGHSPRRIHSSAHKLYRGVHYIHKGKKRYRAIITVNGSNRLLGIFLTAKEAAIARDQAAYEQWGSDALLNFPRPAQPPPKCASKNGVPRKEA